MFKCERHDSDDFCGQRTQKMICWPISLENKEFPEKNCIFSSVTFWSQFFHTFRSHATIQLRLFCFNIFTWSSLNSSSSVYFLSSCFILLQCDKINCTGILLRNLRQPKKKKFACDDHMLPRKDLLAFPDVVHFRNSDEW